MKVSVIVPIYNGARKLPNVLQRLLEKDLPAFEQIVSVVGPTDDTGPRPCRPRYSPR